MARRMLDTGANRGCGGNPSVSLRSTAPLKGEPFASRNCGNVPGCVRRGRRPRRPVCRTRSEAETAAATLQSRLRRASSPYTGEPFASRNCGNVPGCIRRGRRPRRPVCWTWAETEKSGRPQGSPLQLLVKNRHEAGVFRDMAVLLSISGYSSWG